MSSTLHLRKLSTALVALGLCAGVLTAQTPDAATPKADPVRAEQAYLAGARFLDRKDLSAAQEQFARAVALDPQRQDYEMALTLTREHRVSELIQRAARARMTANPKQADTLLAEARAIDPNNELVVEHDQASTAPVVEQTKVTPKEEPSYASPIELKPTTGGQDLHLRGDAKQVITKAALQYGIRTVFDDSVTGQGQPLRFDMDQTPYTEAMPILMRMAHLFSVPVDPTTLLVAKDTEENRQKFERQVEETIYIPASTKEQMDEITNIVKNVFDVKQVVASVGSGTLVVRAPAATLKALNYTLSDMIDGGAEVQLELKLITVDKSITRNLGLSPPTSGTVFSAAAELQSFVTANQSTVTQAISSGLLTPSGSTVQQLIEEAAFLVLAGVADAKLTNVISFFGNGLTLFGASIGGGGTLNFGLNESDSRALDDITVRVSDGQTTTLRMGENYPYTTATYTSGLSSSTAASLAGVSIGGQSAAALLKQYAGASSAANVPMVQYEPLGITLKATPKSMRSGLISMHIDMKIEALAGTALNNIPVLSSSAFVSDITVPEGQTVVMLADMSKTEAASVSGLPGLGDLPGFQETLSDTSKNGENSELVLLITPHLVRRRNISMASRVVPFATSVPQEN